MARTCRPFWTPVPVVSCRLGWWRSSPIASKLTAWSGRAGPASRRFIGLNLNAQRVINLHPALPRTFPGLHAIQRAFEAYQRGEIQCTGVMVHLVPDEGVDSGPVLASQSVPIDPQDTLETLEARVHSVEHKLLVSTLKDLLQKE
ncbi:MAG: formyltransferase family protein [Anaerolineales bacterium]